MSTYEQIEGELELLEDVDEVLSWRRSCAHRQHALAVPVLTLLASPIARASATVELFEGVGCVLQATHELLDVVETVVQQLLVYNRNEQSTET